MRAKLPTVFGRLTLAQRFMLASLVILVTGMLGLGAWVGQQIKTGVINRSGATTALYVDSFVAPLLQELGESREISPAHVETLNRLLSETSFGRQIVAFKAWDLNGKIVFSTDPSAIGITFPISEPLMRSSQGEVTTRVSAEEEENAPQRELHPVLLEIYSPVRLTGTNQVIAVAEYYQTMDELQGEMAAAERRSWLIVGGVTVIIYLLLFGFVRNASDTIQKQQMELNLQISRLTELLAQNHVLSERVRRAAASVTTLNERFLRRIGSDLHDGPAQDLGLALLQLDSMVGHLEEEPPSSNEQQVEQLEKIQALLQNTLKEMRGIATGLGLPELGELKLEEAVVRVVRAHERRTGTKVALSMETVPETAPLPVKITVYRLIQEALNNAFRHAGGVGQEVRISGEGENLRVEVSDQGPGLPEARAAETDGRLGLVGMRERVESLGGSFQVESQSGKGTRVTVGLPLKAEGEDHGE